MNNNIFNSIIGDAVAYLFLYIIIPIVVTLVNYKVLLPDIASEVYFYITVLISTMNCIYDGASRWRGNEKCRRNMKIFAIWIANTIIGIYCIYVILSMLIVKNLDCRHDWVLWFYIVPALIATWDAGIIFLKRVAKKGSGGLIDES